MTEKIEQQVLQRFPYHNKFQSVESYEPGCKIVCRRPGTLALHPGHRLPNQQLAPVNKVSFNRKF